MIKDYYADAVQAAETMIAVMVDDMRLTPPQEFYLDATGEHAWLVAILNPAALGGKINTYINPQTRHQLSTALGGKPVLLSNHSGLRYGVLLSEKPKLPFPVAYPDGLQALGGGVPLGVTLGKKLHPPAASLMNVLVGGEQGSGKSGLMHLFAYAACQNGWKIYAADPRQMTFDETWNGLTLAPVASRANEVNDILAKMEMEMDRRAELFRSVRFGGLPAGNIDAYNTVVGAEKALPRIFFLVDEANTFLADDRVEARVRDLSRQPRKFGMHFVLAAHDWRSDGGIPRGISANFHTRICLRVADDTSGTAVLGNPKMGKAMMKVTKPGRAIVFLDGRFTRVQLYKLADEQVVSMLTAGKPAPLLTGDERDLAERALMETNGKISREVLMGWGLSQTQAIRIAETWTARGWAAKDPLRDNATYITPSLADLVNNPTTATTANNRQTTQTTGPTTPTTGISGLLTV
jgi:hypothetical protein